MKEGGKRKEKVKKTKETQSSSRNKIERKPVSKRRY